MTAFGFKALYNSVSGASYNSAFGYYSLLANTSGTGNTAIGYKILVNNMLGNSNTGVGTQALYSNTQGVANTAIGRSACLQMFQADTMLRMAIQHYIATVPAVTIQLMALRR
jgi:trimeric autotransporter adhesin